MRAGWLLLMLCACGGGVVAEDGSGGAGATGPTGSGPTTSSSSSSSSSSTTGVGGGATDGWETLIEGSWSLPSGSEGYVCVAATMTEDVWVKAFRPIAPEGTHHTVLTKSPFGAQDGVYPCDAGANGENMIYGSGVGSNVMEMPEGVAMHLREGQTLILNLHLYNVGGGELTGMSGTQIQRAQPGEVEHEAQGTLAGTFDILIPPQSPGSASGTCTFGSDATVFAVAPHMHQTGTHMTVTAVPQGGGETVMFDGAYSFEEQLAHPVSPEVAVAGGDRVRVDCQYDNPTSATLTWGDSSDQEMCFGMLYMYPPGGTGFICSD